MAFLGFKPRPKGRHRFRVGVHRKDKPVKPVAGRHRVTGAWDTNFFSGGHRPRHGRKLFGLF